MNVFFASKKQNIQPKNVLKYWFWILALLQDFKLILFFMTYSSYIPINDLDIFLLNFCKPNIPKILILYTFLFYLVWSRSYYCLMIILTIHGWLIIVHNKIKPRISGKPSRIIYNYICALGVVIFCEYFPYFN